MVGIPFEQIKKAAQEVHQYHFRLEHAPGTVYEGDCDTSKEVHHVQMYRPAEHDAVAELVWQSGNGYGRKQGSDSWIRIKDETPSHYMLRASELLETVDWADIAEEHDSWRLQSEIESPLSDEQIREILHGLFEDSLTAKQLAFIDRAVKINRRLMMSIEMHVDRANLLIRSLLISSNIEGHYFKLDFTPQKPSMSADIVSVDLDNVVLSDVEMPSRWLNVSLEKPLGGWKEYFCHGPWAERSLDLIQNMEKTPSRYSEIYDKYWLTERYREEHVHKYTDEKDLKPRHDLYHPIVLGAVYEDETKSLPPFYREWLNPPAANPDYYFKIDGYARDFQHFGGKDIGLERQDICFWFREFKSAPPATRPNNRYYSARDWGYGAGRIDETINRLTFTEAIKQYNRYTYEGKRNAYLMLGHVVHLLQDVGHPDHANLVAHPGSGKTESEVYAETHYCEVLAAEAAAAPALTSILTFGFGFFAAASVFASTYAACIATVSGTVGDAEVGYEKLVSMPEIWQAIQQHLGDEDSSMAVMRLRDYDSYFGALSDYAIRVAKQHNLRSPLGCGDMSLLPCGDGLDPDIESDDPEQTKPYINLTIDLLPSIIGYTAGMIQHFYEIVNHPPFVERVTIVKAQSGLTPRGYAQFKETIHCADGSTTPLLYDAQWKMNGDARRKLEMLIEPRVLSANQAAYVFIQFGPSLEPLMNKRVKIDSVRLISETPPYTKNVEMHEQENEALGWYYWGMFEPSESELEYSLQFEVQATDVSAHFMERPAPYQGSIIDARPESVAIVDPTSPPLYPLRNYDPGVDRNHKIKVAPLIQQDIYEHNNSFESAAELDINIENYKSDEPIYGLTLHSDKDIDYFRLKYTIEERDRGVSGGRDEIIPGMFVDHIPPQLVIWVEEESGSCVTIDIHGHDKILMGQPLTGNRVERIFEKSEILNNEGVLFLTVRNPDYHSQGALRYRLFARYTHAHPVLSGEVVYSFWEEEDFAPWTSTFQIDRPPTSSYILDKILPDPPAEAIVYPDYAQFVADFETAIPNILERYTFANVIEKSTMEAKFTHAIGIFAHQTGLYNASEALLVASEKLFQQTGDGIHMAGVLNDLIEVYAVQNRQADIDRVVDRLRLIN